MVKVRRKDADLEATQWMKPGDHPAVKSSSTDLNLPEGAVTYVDGKEIGFLSDGSRVRSGDWIVSQPDGRRLMCFSAAEFAAAFDVVEG